MTVPWKCESCGKFGVIELISGPETVHVELLLALHGQHQLASPDCPSENLQIQVPVIRKNMYARIEGWTQ